MINMLEKPSEGYMCVNCVDGDIGQNQIALQIYSLG